MTYAQKRTAWQVFESRDYRMFIVGTGLANVAHWMQLLALGWLAVELALRDGRIEGTSLYLGLLGLARLVPALAFGLLGGVAADRLDRRRLLMTTRVASSLVAAVMALATLGGVMSIVLAMVLTMLAATVSAFDQPARLSMSPTLVPPRDAFAAISIARSTMLASSLVGPLVAGQLIVHTGTGGSLLACAVFFVASSLGLSRIRRTSRLTVAVTGPVTALREVFSYVGTERSLVALMTATIVFATFAQSYSQLLPALAHDRLQVGAVQLAWLTAAGGLGGLLGATVVSTMGSWPRLGRILIIDGFLVGAFLVLLGLQREFASALVVAGLLGVVSMIYYGGTGNVIQLTVPDALRGRVMGAHITSFQTGAPLGTLMLGSLATVVGISNALVVAGLMILLAVACLSRVSAVRNVESDKLMAMAGED